MLSGGRFHLGIGAHPAIVFRTTTDSTNGVQESGAVKHTHFVASRANLTNVRFSDRYFVQVAPQLYYLRTDGRDGFYLNSGLTLADRRLPLSISAMVNTALRTRIAAAEGFLWNVSLNYSIR